MLHVPRVDSYNYRGTFSRECFEISFLISPLLYMHVHVHVLLVVPSFDNEGTFLAPKLFGSRHWGTSWPYNCVR